MKKILLLIFLVSILTTMTVFSVSENTAFADTVDVITIDTSDVMDDLTSDPNFNLADYPVEVNGDIDVVRFYEYRYGTDDYSLYVYVYNPTCHPLYSDWAYNKIQFTTGEATESSYEKYGLDCVNVSNDNLFFKFKVLGVGEERLADRLDPNSRKYNVSGLEIRFAMAPIRIDEVPVGKTYTYTGYAVGCNNGNEESTLKCTVNVLDTIELEVQHTDYKWQTHVDGGTQVSTAYFAVPNKYFEEYKGLQTIRAEWWEYLLQPVVCTNNKALYDALLPWLYIDIGTRNKDIGYYLGWYPYDDLRQWSYNYGPSDADIADTSLDMLIWCEEDNISDCYIAGSEVLEKIYEAQEYYGDDKYLNMVFEDHVDDGRTYGYNDETFNAGVEKVINPYEYDSALKDWWAKLIYPDIEEGALKIDTPIYTVRDKDLEYTDEELARRLLITERDVSKFREYYSEQTALGNKVVLFRFAQTEYISSELEVHSDDRLSTYDPIIPNSAFLAQETVFLDFDIIELGFNRYDGEIAIIPVVSAPIDIVGDIEPPIEDDIIGGIEDNIQDGLDDLKQLFDSGKDKWAALWEKVQKIMALVLGCIVLIVAITLLVIVINKIRQAVRNKRLDDATKEILNQRKKE